MNSNVQVGQRHRGLYGLLSKPAIYEFIQQLVAGRKGRRFQKNFVDNHVVPRQGSRVLDIGCGPGTILNCIPEELNCQYCGFDMNPTYIEAAQARYGHRPRLRAGGHRVRRLRAGLGIPRPGPARRARGRPGGPAAAARRRQQRR